MGISLTALNTFAGQGLPYIDYRNPSITYSNNTVTTGTIICSANTALSVANPVGVTISSFVNLGSMTYSIDLSHTQGATVTWPTLTSNITSNVSGNVYSVSGFTDSIGWTLIQSPTINITNPNLPQSYTCTLYYTIGSTQHITWTNVIIPFVKTELFAANTDNTYVAGTITSISGNPTATYASMTSLSTLPN